MIGELIKGHGGSGRLPFPVRCLVLGGLKNSRAVGSVCDAFHRMINVCLLIIRHPVMMVIGYATKILNWRCYLIEIWCIVRNLSLVTLLAFYAVNRQAEM
jgi:hypothetical protein